MIIKQISVFLENKAGRLLEVLSTLANAGINVVACSVADTSEFGIIRLIVSDPDKAHKILKDKQFSANINEVVAIYTPNIPGALEKALEILANENISIEYLYAFAINEKAFVIMKPDNIEKTIMTFQRHQMELIKSNELYNF